MTEPSLLTRRFWSLLLQIMQTSSESRFLISLTNTSAQLSLEGRLVIVLLDESEQIHAQLEHWLGQLEHLGANAVDILILSNDLSIRNMLERSTKSSGKKVSIYHLNEHGDFWMGPHSTNRSPVVDAVKKTVHEDVFLDVEEMKDRLGELEKKSKSTFRELMQFQENFQVQSYTTTVVLAAVIVGLFVLEELWGGSTFAPTLVHMGANARDFVFAGEVWRLMTSIFLHAGYLHIFFNTYVLVALGSFFNRLFGGAKFLSLLLLSGLTGSVASAFIGQSHLSIGASGALWGMFGASAALILRPSALVPEIIRARMKRLTLINLGINLAISFLPQVDFWAHIGGGVGGFLVGMIFVRQAAPAVRQMISHQEKALWPQRLMKIVKQPLALILSLLMLCSFAVAFATQRPWLLTQDLKLEMQHIDNLDFSIGVPTLLATRMFKQEGQINYAQFGEVPYDPIQITLKAQTLENAPKSSSEQLEFLYRRLADMAQSSQLNSIEPPQQNISDGFMTVSTRFQLRDRSKLYMWYQIRNDQLVQLEIIVIPGTSEKIVKGIPEIFASMSDSGQFI